MTVAYHIHDEPVGRPNRIPALDPFWPLIAMMFGGAWLGALAFAMNAWVLRGPTRLREISLAIAILIGAPVLLFLLGSLSAAAGLSSSGFKYVVLLIIAWKLGLAYWIYFLQQNSHALYEYFGGAAARGQGATLGVVLVFAGGYLKPQVVNAVASPFWEIMVS